MCHANATISICVAKMPANRASQNRTSIAGSEFHSVTSFEVLSALEMQLISSHLHSFNDFINV
jgi:hypothetical protein